MKNQVEEFLLDKSKIKKINYFKYNQDLIKLSDDLKWFTNINLFELSILNLQTVINRMINILEKKKILKMNEVSVEKHISIKNTDFYRYSYFRTKLFSLVIFYDNENRKKELVYILKKYIPYQLNFYISSLNFIKI